MRDPKDPIESVMTRNPLTIEQHFEIGIALAKMKDLQINHLPVLTGGKLVGILSERDLMFAATFKHGDGKKLQVQDVMISDPITFPEGSPISEVTKRMVKDKIGSVLIVNKDNKLSGIFTYTDALSILAGMK